LSEEQATRRCDFFISHTGADTTWAEWIAWQLKQAGYTVTIQAWHFRPGDNFVALMRQALDACQRTVAVVSQAYLDQSKYGSDEWTAAFTHDDPTSSSLLLVLVEPVTLPRLLRPWIHISLAGLAPEQAAVRLLKGVNPGPVEPTVAPAFPGRSVPAASGGPRYPSQHPEISNLPARNPAFAGRDDLLDQLRQRLRQESAAALVPAQALHGLGGVGKTQLALEYAHRYQADYTLVWWILAEAPGATPAGLAQLGVRLGLVNDIAQVADQEQLAVAVLDELRQRQRWLLIFDNVPDRQQLASYLPQGDGQVLITSRSPIWGGTAQPIKVNVFTRDESLSFLAQRIISYDETTAAELAEELGDLPLAVEQAGAYLEQTGMALHDYLGLFRHRREGLLKLGQPTAYNGTVDTTWQLAIEKIALIQPGGPAGVELLRFCAFLAPEAIPLDLLTGHGDLLPKELAKAVRDDLALQEAIAAVYGYSLVDRDHTGLRIHRLVQAVVRDHLSPQDRGAWAGITAHVLEDAFPANPNEPGTWPRCAELVSHLLATVDHAATGAAEHSTGGARAGVYLRNRGDYSASCEVLKKALALADDSPEPDQRLVLEILNELSQSLRYLGDLAGARASQERALTIAEATLEPNDPLLAITLHNLALVLRRDDELASARAYFERAAATFESVFDNDHPWVGIALNQLGSVLQDLGDLAGARAACERALKIAEAAFGSDHPDVAAALDTLSTVLRKEGDLDGARAAIERSLVIEKVTRGLDHPEAGVAYSNLGLVLQEQEDLVGARAAFERALATLRPVLGSEHPFIQSLLNSLARL
jgi:tetratricopeptide (TPR) repeat protein